MLLAHLIQAGYYGHPSGFFYGMSAGTMGSWILIIVIGIVGWIVQARLQSVFAKYARVPFPGGLTGAEVAEKMLRDNGIRNVKVTHVAGHLTDHFNPQTMTVNLSDSVYASRSVAAAAVAAHECGHAVQHARGYAPLELRSQLVPIVNFSARAATFVLIAGMILLATTDNAWVCWIGVGLIAVSALFSIVTLPVEYNASERALAWLESSRTMQGAELAQAREALTWAARTYLVAALSAIATVLYYAMLILGRSSASPSSRRRRSAAFRSAGPTSSRTSSVSTTRKQRTRRCRSSTTSSRATSTASRGSSTPAKRPCRPIRSQRSRLPPTRCPPHRSSLSNGRPPTANRRRSLLRAIPHGY